VLISNNRQLKSLPVSFQAVVYLVPAGKDKIFFQKLMHIMLNSNDHQDIKFFFRIVFSFSVG